jgi:hypothetical protein
MIATFVATPNARDRRLRSSTGLGVAAEPRIGHVAAQHPVGWSRGCGLPLGVLRRLTGSLEADLLTLFDASVPGQQLCLFEDRPELFIEP